MLGAVSPYRIAQNTGDMKWHLLTAVILGLVLAGAVSAAPSSEDTQRLRFRYVDKKWSVRINGDEKMSRVFRMNSIPSNPYSDQFLLKKMDQLYEQIAQEVAEAEQRHEDYTVLMQESDFFSNDINKQLKGIMLHKLKQMYDQTMAQNNIHLNPESWRDGDNTETGKLIDRFLHDKIRSAILQSRRHEETGSYDNASSTSSHEQQAHVMTDQSNYIPIYKFDRAAGEYCYPDWPSAANDYNCVTSLNANAPVFYQVNTCGGETVYTYWLWYGLQKPCIFNQGTHGDDWEHVSVYVNPSNGEVSKVVYHQHGGHYTRRRGEYKAKGERPIVYIGKVAHGSYHIDCNGACSFSEFLNHGCYGSVRFCIGGCGYWDDFRNPKNSDDELTTPQLHPLQKGQNIDGITRPDREICGLATCEGSDSRSLLESGCWQDKP